MRPKRPGCRRNVQAVDANAIAADRLRPRMKRRDVLRPRRIGGRILALVRDILRPRGDETHDASTCGHDHLAVSGRHDHQRVARHADRFAPRSDRDRCLPVRHQHDVFIALILTGEDRARLGVAVGHDEVLTARVPGAGRLVRSPAARSRRNARTGPPRNRPPEERRTQLPSSTGRAASADPTRHTSPSSHTLF